MGHNVSAIAGVKSSNFYEQGNAINEIWVDDVELISRLPFGDSDLGQAGWPKGGWPKIPWHQFIIPLKRDLSQNITMSNQDANPPAPQVHCVVSIIYPLKGYMAMYKGWNPALGEYFAGMLLLVAIWLIGEVFFSLRWDRFCLELQGLVPKHRRTTNPTIDIPTEIRSACGLSNLIKRWFLRKCLLLGVALLLIVFAYPATVVGIGDDNVYSRVTVLGEYLMINMVTVLVVCILICVMFIFLFYQAVRERQVRESFQVVQIAGTDMWTIAYFPREVTSLPTVPTVPPVASLQPAFGTTGQP